MRTTLHSAFLLPLSAVLCLCAAASAADAGFTPDKKHVIQIEPEARRTLLEIDVSTGAARPLFAPLKEEIAAISLDAKDRWILATGQTLWSWKPGDAAPARLAAVPSTGKGRKVAVEDLAADPKSGRILVTVSETAADGSDYGTPAWIYNTEDSKWGKVRCRYVTGINTPCFNARGELYFSVEGDLWHGLIEEDEPWTLVAYRYAAVATRYTYNGSPMQSGTRQLAAAGDELIINHGRMGGSGWGTITALPAPLLDLSAEWDTPDLKGQLSTAGKIAGALKELGDGDGRISSGSSRDGTHAWFLWPDADKALLYTGGTAKEIRVTLPESSEKE